MATAPVLRICDVCALWPILKHIDAPTITREEAMKLAKKWRRETRATLAMLIDIDLDATALIRAVNAIPDKESDLNNEELLALFALMYASRDKYPDFWKTFCDQMKLVDGASAEFAMRALFVWNLHTAPMAFPPNLQRFDEALVEQVNGGTGLLHEFNILYTRYETMGPIDKVKEWPTIFAFNRALGNMFGRWETVTVVLGVGVRFGTGSCVINSPSDSVSKEFVKYGHLCALKI